MRALLGAALALCVAVGARAAEFAVLDADAVPHVKQDGRQSYARFATMNLPRAFAVSPDGAYGWQSGGGDAAWVRTKALENCAAKGAKGCALYAEDLRVVWPGKASVEPTKPPTAPLVPGRDFAIDTDQRYFWRGPAQARGLYVWGHGTGGGFDSRNAQPQGHARHFNNAGFDIAKFNRDPGQDYPGPAAAFLRDALGQLCRQGWRTIVVAGQSRGAWNSLQMLSTPGLADAVIGIAAASFSSNASYGGQGAELYSLLSDANSPKTRVALAQFEGDIYMPDLDSRAKKFREMLPGKVAAVLLIDRPAGINGHGGGASAAFSERYGACLLRFVTDPSPPASCP